MVSLSMKVEQSDQTDLFTQPHVTLTPRDLTMTSLFPLKRRRARRSLFLLFFESLADKTDETKAVMSAPLSLALQWEKVMNMQRAANCSDLGFRHRPRCFA